MFVPQTRLGLKAWFSREVLKTNWINKREKKVPFYLVFIGLARVNGSFKHSLS